MPISDPHCSGKRWARWQDKILIEHYHKTHAGQIARMVNRTKDSIYQRAHRLGLRLRKKRARNKKPGERRLRPRTKMATVMKGRLYNDARTWI